MYSPFKNEAEISDNGWRYPKFRAEREEFGQSVSEVGYTPVRRPEGRATIVAKRLRGDIIFRYQLV